MKIFLDALSKGPTVSIGTQALIIGSMEILSKHIKNAEFVMLSRYPDLENAYLSKEPYKVELVNRGDSQLGAILDIKKIINRVDCVVSAWGDGYITTPPHKISNTSWDFSEMDKSL